MRYYAAVILLVVAFASCKKDSASTLAPTVKLEEKVDTTLSTLEKDGGGFISRSASEGVSGNVKIYSTNGLYEVALVDFKSSNGPALKVYLSKEINPINFVSLGSLRSTMGDQLYDVPSSVNINDYQYVLIYCEQYRSLYGYAKLSN